MTPKIFILLVDSIPSMLNCFILFLLPIFNALHLLILRDNSREFNSIYISSIILTASYNVLALKLISSAYALAISLLFVYLLMTSNTSSIYIINK